MDRPLDLSEPPISKLELDDSQPWSFRVIWMRVQGELSMQSTGPRAWHTACGSSCDNTIADRRLILLPDC